MILKKYLIKRFLKYFLIVNALLCVLFNFIEFFEKLTHAKHAATKTILHFLSLNLVPSFFDLMPLSSWIATILLIKELNQQHEFEIIQLLSVNHKKLLNIFALAGLIATLICMSGRETFVSSIANQSEKFKADKFKQHSDQIIINKWLLLQENVFCFVGSLNFETKTGTNLLLLQNSPEFKIQRVLQAPSFKIDQINHALFLKKGIASDTQKATHTKFENYTLILPSFFINLRFIDNTKSILAYSKQLILFKNFMPKATYNELLYKLFKHIFVYLQIILYPLLTLLLFFMFQGTRPFIHWLIVFIPYPTILFMETILDMFAQQGINSLFTLLPYLMLYIFIAFCSYFIL